MAGFNERSLERATKKFLAKVHDQEQRTKMLRTYSFIVPATPVDTGHARTSWDLSFNKPSTDYTPYPFADVTGARARAESVFLTSRGPYSDMYLSNGAPYILELDRGSSQQAPSNFVFQAVFKALKSK